MHVKEAKGHIVNFPKHKEGALIKLLDELHLPPGKEEQNGMEAQRVMYRLMSRFIDLANSQPVRNIRPTHEEICQKVEDFAVNLDLPDSMRIMDTRLEGKKGLAFFALFNIFAHFINYREMPEGYTHFPIIPIEEMDISQFKQLVQNFIEPKNRTYKATWEINLDTSPSKMDYVTSCHIFLLRLHFYAVYSYLEIAQPKSEPTLGKIREETKKFLSALPWEDSCRLSEISSTDNNGAAILAIYEIILNFYSLPKPEPPSIFKQLIGRRKPR